MFRSRCRVSWVITAVLKSSHMSDDDERSSMRGGTTQGPVRRRASPLIDPQLGGTWPGRQVGGEHGQLCVNAGGQRRREAFLELAGSQAAVVGRVSQDLYGPVPVPV